MKKYKNRVTTFFIGYVNILWKRPPIHDLTSQDKNSEKFVFAKLSQIAQDPIVIPIAIL